jgi:hypothetical protein
MLRACLISCKDSLEKWLPLIEFSYNNSYQEKLIEFSYNNSYQESIKMALFEALYGCKCKTPLNWVELGERRFYDIDFVKEAEE